MSQNTTSPTTSKQLPPLRENNESARWLFRYAIVAFVIAIVVIGICVGWQLNADAFPSGDGLYAFAIMLQVTIGHSLFNLFLTTSLLILRRWRSAIG